MCAIKFTKYIVLFLTFCNLYGLCGQFNTVVRSNVEKVVSELSLTDSLEKVERDSIVELMEVKKVQYNMGVLPLEDIYVTSFYGSRIHPITGVYAYHRGVDLRANEKMVYAVQSGVIYDVGYDKKLGEYVKLRCGDFTFVYGHLAHVYVKPGTMVKSGDILGKTGETGSVTAEHLHFAIKKGQEYLDPYPILKLINDGLNVDMGASGDNFDIK